MPSIPELNILFHLEELDFTEAVADGGAVEVENRNPAVFLTGHSPWSVLGEDDADLLVCEFNLNSFCRYEAGFKQVASFDPDSGRIFVFAYRGG